MDHEGVVHGEGMPQTQAVARREGAVNLVWNPSRGLVARLVAKQAQLVLLLPLMLQANWHVADNAISSVGRDSTHQDAFSSERTPAAGVALKSQAHQPRFNKAISGHWHSNQGTVTVVYEESRNGYNLASFRQGRLLALGKIQHPTDRHSIFDKSKVCLNRVR